MSQVPVDPPADDLDRHSGALDHARVSMSGASAAPRRLAPPLPSR